MSCQRFDIYFQSKKPEHSGYQKQSSLQAAPSAGTQATACLCLLRWAQTFLQAVHNEYRGTKLSIQYKNERCLVGILEVVSGEKETQLALPYSGEANKQPFPPVPSWQAHSSGWP